MQLAIKKLVYGGDGLARLPADERGLGKTVFVPFSIDGEEVEAKLTEQKPGFSRARIERVVAPSPDRIAPRCPYFLRCGGCQYQHASYARQLKAKSEILLETLKRTAKIDLPCELQLHASPEWGYRNRTRLKLQFAPEFALGYYQFRSHELLPIERCPISSPGINRAIAQLWDAGRRREISTVIQEIELFADHADERMLTEIYCQPGTTETTAKEAAEKMWPGLENVVGVAGFEQASHNQLAEPKKLASVGDPQLTYETSSAGYRVSAGAFFQVNRFLIDELVAASTGGASGKLALDLYAGVGLFATLLAKSFAQVIAVEASPACHSDLRRNVSPEIKTVLATTERYLGQVAGLRPDLVVVDPPRGGLGENVARGVAKLDAPQIRYVSCDPATLARDLRVLVGLGYEIGEAHLMDLFPQTYHIESVLHLVRERKRR
jgi:23S rRNA (uracil1939-C5)-methyltransferase